MQTEYEAKFLDINHDDMRARLAALEATLEQPMRPMYRVILNIDESGEEYDYGQSFVRLRDEGDKITLTHKTFTKQAVDGAQEIETTVGDFETTRQFLKAVGLFEHSYQESRRETWLIDDVKVELDEWPWIRPFIEVEGESEAAVKTMAERLGLKWQDARFGDVTTAYLAEYDVEPRHVGRHPKIVFAEQPPKEWPKK